MTTTSDMARLLMMQGTQVPDAGLGPVTNTTRAGRPNPMLTAPPNQERPADYMQPVAELLSLPMGAYGAGQLVGSGINAAREGDYASGAGQIALGMAGMLPMAPKGGKGIRAFHGSPHDFDRFSMEHIGKGEGAQAYGHGLYFAEAEDVARSYKDALRGKAGFTGPEKTAQEFIGKHGGDVERARKDLNQQLLNPNIVGEHRADLEAARDLLYDGYNKSAGHMYEVRINADPQDFLDYDAGISRQPEKVRQALSKIADDAGIPRGGFGDEIRSGDLDTLRTYVEQSLPRGEFEKRLKDLGIPGIRYLDQMSRGAGKGSSNYVVFDDSLIEILRKYGLLGPVAGGGALAGMLMGGQDGETY